MTRVPGRDPWGPAALLFVALFALGHWRMVAGHATFSDQGYHLNVLANAAAGEPGRMSFVDPDYGSRTFIHFSLPLYALAPLYRLVPWRGWLPLATAFGLALGLVGFSRLARATARDAGPGGGEPAAAGREAAWLYLLTPTIWYWAAADFRSSIFVFPILLWALAFLEAGRPRAGVAALLCGLLTREEAGIGVAAGAVVGALRGKLRPGVAAGVVGVAAAAFLALNAVFLPGLGSKDPANHPQLADRYGHMGGSLGEVAASLVLRPVESLRASYHPAKAIHLGLLLLPSLGVVAAAPEVAVGAAPTLLASGLARARRMLDIRNHYIAAAMPFVLFAIWLGLRRVRARLAGRPRAARAFERAFRVTFAGAFVGLAVLRPWDHDVTGRRAFVDHMPALRTLVPPDAVLAVQDRLFPYFADNRHVRRLEWSDPAVPDWVLVAVREPVSPPGFMPWSARPAGPTSVEFAPEIVADELARARYEVAYGRDGVFALRRVPGPPDPALRCVLREAMAPGTTRPDPGCPPDPARPYPAGGSSPTPR